MSGLLGLQASLRQAGETTEPPNRDSVAADNRRQNRLVDARCVAHALGLSEQRDVRRGDPSRQPLGGETRSVFRGPVVTNEETATELLRLLEHHLRTGVLPQLEKDWATIQAVRRRL